MPRLLNTAGANTIGASQKSQVFRCMGGDMHFYIGGTPDTNTLTLTAGFSKDGTFYPYSVDNVSGTPVAQTFTAAQLGSGVYHTVYRQHSSEDVYFQFSTNGTGTGVAWIVAAEGRIQLTDL